MLEKAVLAKLASFRRI